MKTEPDTYSIDDLENDATTPWEGVRNYQARNIMRDQMKIGDRVLFYHSNAKSPGIVGIAEVCKLAYPDFFAWDPTSKYFDPKSTPDKPIWQMVDVKYIARFNELISLHDLKKIPELDGMMLLRKGARLSVQPVIKEHFDLILNLGLLY